MMSGAFGAVSGVAELDFFGADCPPCSFILGFSRSSLNAPGPAEARTSISAMPTNRSGTPGIRGTSPAWLPFLLLCFDRGADDWPSRSWLGNFPPIKGRPPLRALSNAVELFRAGEQVSDT
jgi:hypothetical protein